MIYALLNGDWMNGTWVGGCVMRVINDVAWGSFEAWLFYRWIEAGSPKFWLVKRSPPDRTAKPRASRRAP